MTVDEATKFFKDNCYYEEAPARAEAERGTHDPGYCFYTIGKLEFLKLRADYQKQQGDKFSLKQFHDEMLRHGAPADSLAAQKRCCAIQNRGITRCDACPTALFANPQCPCGIRQAALGFSFLRARRRHGHTKGPNMGTLWAPRQLPFEAPHSFT